MDDPNNKVLKIKNGLNESTISTISSTERKHSKEMAKKIQKFEMEKSEKYTPHFSMKKNNYWPIIMMTICGIIFCAALILAIGLLFGEKFEKMEKEMDEKLNREISEIKKTNEELMGNGHELMKKMAKIKDEFDEKNAKLDREIIEKSGKMEELNVSLDGLKGEMATLKEEIAGKNAELEWRIIGLLKKDDGNASESEEQIKNALMANLTETIDGIEWAKFDSNAYKLNDKDCGPKMDISENGYVVTQSDYGTNCVRAVLPIPTINSKVKKPTIVFYYEVEILELPPDFYNGMDPGFCTDQFPLEYRMLGLFNNSIGLYQKEVMWFDKFNETYFDLFFDELNTTQSYSEGDVIGLGIIYSPTRKRNIPKVECFATLGEKFLGKVKLPAKFSTLQLFPAITLFEEGTSIRANFRKEQWLFKQFHKVFE